MNLTVLTAACGRRLADMLSIGTLFDDEQRLLNRVWILLLGLEALLVLVGAASAAVQAVVAVRRRRQRQRMMGAGAGRLRRRVVIELPATVLEEDEDEDGALDQDLFAPREKSTKRFAAVMSSPSWKV